MWDYKDILQKIKRSWTLDCGCNFSRDECGVSNKKDREIGIVMVLAYSVGDI